MGTFNSARDAKEYLVASIVAEAYRKGVPLSDVERKMLYFTESAWTLPDMSKVSEQFDRDYVQSDYEAKIGMIAQGARLANSSGIETWDEATSLLEGEDHYLTVLVRAGTKKPEVSPHSPFVDRVKLVATAIVIIVVMFAAMYLFKR